MSDWNRGRDEREKEIIKLIEDDLKLVRNARYTKGQKELIIKTEEELIAKIRGEGK